MIVEQRKKRISGFKYLGLLILTLLPCILLGNKGLLSDLSLELV
jgi:hypothetical protein